MDLTKLKLRGSEKQAELIICHISLVTVTFRKNNLFVFICCNQKNSAERGLKKHWLGPNAVSVDIAREPTRAFILAFQNVL